MMRGALFAAFIVALPLEAAAENFRFIALGDIPYGKQSDPDGAQSGAHTRYKALIGAINARKPDLVVHVGDTKSGGTDCTNEVLDHQRAHLNSFDAPTLYTPGDNEWTDCHRKKAGGFDPIERLAYIRQTYFADPHLSLGRTQISLDHQSQRGFPENARVMREGVMFVTSHIVGSNNGFEARELDAAREFFARSDATDDWIEESFEAATAQDAGAVVLALHADMFEFDWNQFGEEDWLRHSGFRQVGREIRKQAKRFAKPVLLVFGDSHQFRVFRPFPKTAPNVTALEVFGAADMHAVEVTVTMDEGTARFGFSPLLNPMR